MKTTFPFQPKCDKLRQVQHGGAQEGVELAPLWHHPGEVEGGGAGAPVPLLGRERKNSHLYIGEKQKPRIDKYMWRKKIILSMSTSAPCSLRTSLATNSVSCLCDPPWKGSKMRTRRGRSEEDMSPSQTIINQSPKYSNVPYFAGCSYGSDPLQFAIANNAFNTLHFNVSVTQLFKCRAIFLVRTRSRHLFRPFPPDVNLPRGEKNGRGKINI